MGAVDEAGKIAGGFMGAMRGQPLSLALVFMNLALLVLVFYTANEQNAGRRYMAELVLKQQSGTELLLSKCIDVESIRRLFEAQRQPTP